MRLVNALGLLVLLCFGPLVRGQMNYSGGFTGVFTGNLGGGTNLIGEIINAQRDFGAGLGTIGVTDDSVAVQNALNTAEAYFSGNDNRAVFLPAGVYGFSNAVTLPTGTSLVGENSFGGTGGTTIIPLSTNACFIIGNIGDLRGISIDSSGDFGVGPNVTNTGVILMGYRSGVRDCYFNGLGNAVIVTNVGGSFSHTAYASEIEGCQFGHCSNSVFASGVITGLRIFHNHFGYSTNGIWLASIPSAGQANFITENIFRYNSFWDINLSNQVHTVITGNTFTNLSGTLIASIMATNCPNLELIGNGFYCNTQYGETYLSASNCPAAYLAGNYFGSVSNACLFDSLSTGYTMIGNYNLSGPSGLTLAMQGSTAPVNIWTNVAATTTYWTNYTGRSVFVTVGGGTVTAVGLNYTTLDTLGNAMVPVSPGGVVSVAYTVAPTMYMIYY